MLRRVDGSERRGARVAPRVAAADEACGQAAPSTPEPLTDEQKDWARGAWDWGCRVAGRAGCRSFPSQNVHAGRAREAKRDQGQAFEILEFQAWKTGRNRRANAGRPRFPASWRSGTSKPNIRVHGLFQSRRISRWLGLGTRFWYDENPGPRGKPRQRSMAGVGVERSKWVVSGVGP
jgi:hypothetical protein